MPDERRRRFDEFETEEDLGVAGLVDLYAPRIADSPETRQALTTILTAADDPEKLDLVEAAAREGGFPTTSRRLTRRSTGGGTRGEVPVGPPDADQQDFAPGATVKTWAARDGQPPVGSMVLGGGMDLATRLSKARMHCWAGASGVVLDDEETARIVGESGVHDLVAGPADGCWGRECT